MENGLEIFWKAVGAVGSLILIIGLFFQPIRKRITFLEETSVKHADMISNRLTKEETTEAIELRMRPFVQATENLRESVHDLHEAVKELSNCQYRMIGELQAKREIR